MELCIQKKAIKGVERDGIYGMDSEMGNTRAGAAMFSLNLITCFMFKLCACIPLMETKNNFQNNAIGVLLYKLLCIALIFSLGPITRNEMTGSKDLIILRSYLYQYICMFISIYIYICIYIYIILSGYSYFSFLPDSLEFRSCLFPHIPITVECPYHCGVLPLKSFCLSDE